MAKKNSSYNDAVAEIEDILRKIENEELDVDELGKNVERVSFLLKMCKEKLHKTEVEVEKILGEMEG